MRRADRLFRLVELLRQRRFATGAWLAEELQVSLRTLYRDISDLCASGVPIEGEAGVGYRLRYRLDVPPLLFDAQELEALLVGTRMVQAWGDAALAGAAAAALAKIHNALPETLRREARIASLYVPPCPPRAPWLQDLRAAARTRQVVTIDYRREDGMPSTRTLWPLGLFFWGHAWTLVGWCTLRGDFRQFRVDRIAAMQCEDAVFPEERGKRLDDYFDQVEQRENIKIPRRRGLF